YFALFALQQSKSGYFQIETLLTSIGYGKEIETARIDGSAAFNLKRSFDRGIKILAKFEHPYTFVYDADVPEWTRSNSKIKKPRYWFDQWLHCFGTLNQPEIKLKPKPQKALQPDFQANKKQLAISDTTLNTNILIFGQQIRKARIANKESLRTMAKELHISPSRLSQIENGCYPHPVTPELKVQVLTYLGLET
ncbi:transcriptional regulator, partial [Pleurocapsa sp. CCALA 161]|uniref:helix-turn-helix domain-containing protein n=1 Tax=Pleurocapsa sp. CCALA 161 TaxID=2107688 RepID=UPI000D437636